MGKKLTLTVEKLVDGGAGLCRTEGKAVFIPYVVPGEKILVELVEEKKQYCVAKLIEVLEPAHQRRQPPCSLFTTCGGCNWLHLDYSEQKKQKIHLVMEAFRRIGKTVVAPPELVSGEEFGYRNRVQMHTNNQGYLGFMKNLSNEVVPVKTCPVVHPEINDFIEKSSQKTFPPNQRLPFFAEKGVLSGFLTPHSDAPFQTEILGKRIYLDPFSFFQSNLKLLPALINFILEGENGRLAVDLYSGVGLYSVFLMEKFEQTIGVEQNLRADSLAKKNLHKQNYSHIPSSIENLKEGGLPTEEIDYLVINPPRTGLSPVATQKVLSLKAKRICYVSCNPVTQARDTKLILRSYSIEKMKLFDFYPQTSHVESVIKFCQND